ncbi:hypothetical protein DUNSADRAFT_14099 [Dunaliella salina]|uniref:Transferrin-like domain-containing protein n=1 Tax=Dunaliella salina TaxID=3046 RepID=A0ABQ7G7Z9_DUNSA|nr:hypothetical protein DUNSADRAFT_14099 [Dunaliella salina]KAF5830739.1 hypothetical protein DUNSADRAFT_14099 [Dunaliella salina]|eukprot:KAF5830738.1 hypothetical protein DUNSADRAFT_14099 [Dunaliella salina]
MASTRAPMLALLALLYAASVRAQIRVCIAPASLSTSDCKTALENAYGTSPGFTCNTANSDDECLERVNDGTDHVTIVGGNQLFNAHAKYNLHAIVAESSGLGDASYWGVALTKRGKCATVDGNDVSPPGPIKGLDDSLRGRKACHTGYRKTSGWYLPVGKLADKGLMDFSQWAEEAANHDPPVQTDAETVEKFWDDNVCAPGTTANGPTREGNIYGSVGPNGGGLCKLCKGDCTSTDPYAGYEGALYCMDQEGDIAFVKHSTVRDYDASDDADKEPLTETDKSTYVGICDSGCMTLFNSDGSPIQNSDGSFQYEMCSTGKSASNSMVARKDFIGSSEYQALLSAMSLSSSDSAAIDAGDITTDEANALKQEDTVGLWGDDTQSLIKVADDDFKSFFTAYDGFREIRNSGFTLRFCIAGEASIASCESALNSAYGTGNSYQEYECIKRDSDDLCLQAVEEGDAHATIVGGNQLYSANAKYNLAAIAAESASDDLGTASYWGVALTKRGKCATVDGESVGGPITGLDDSIRGRKACHTGYRKTSGWFLPVGKLADKGLMDFSQWAEEAANHDPPVRVDAETVEKFWEDNVCAPGTTANGPTLAGNIYGEVQTENQEGAGLCKLCKRDCTSTDPYAGYEGALYCMDQEGDIAFVKHSTVRDYDPSDDADKEALTESDKSTYVGICDAGCMTLFDSNGNPLENSDGNGFKYEMCSTGKSASNSLVVRKDFIGTSDYDKLMTALGLMNSDSADVTSPALKNEDEAGLWGSDTSKLYKISEPATDDGFKSFFTAYDGFQEIRNSDSGLRVCISGTAMTSSCEEALDAAYGSSGMSFYCMKKSEIGCLEAVKTGEAHVTVVGGNELFAAHNQYNLAAIVAEQASSELEDASYWGVAITKKSNCAAVDGNSESGDITGLDSSIKGKAACHTGYRKTSGWYLPVGTLAKDNVIDFSQYATEAATEYDPPVQVDAETIEQFWDEKVCAPGTTANGPRVDGTAYGSVGANGGGLCKRCKSDCTSTDPYAGYKGAVYCIDDEDNNENTGGDIAFVKHSTLRDYSEPLNTAKNDYVGICPTKADGSSGGCMTLFDSNGNPIEDPNGNGFKYESCSTGKSASNAMVSSRAFVGTDMYNSLMSALGLANGDVADVTSSMITNEASVGLWGSDTRQLRKIANPATTQGFKDFFTAYDQFREIRNSEFANNDNKDEVKVCVPRNDDAELVRRCTDVMNVQYGTTELYFNCQPASNVEACQQGIEDGTFDITTLGGDGLFTSYEEYDLEPLVAEIYITGEPASYFGIGVVKASQCGEGRPFTGKNKESLQGKDSCHTGYRKTAGWYLPIGSLLSAGIMPAVEDPNGEVQTDAYSANEFFGRVCAPRATDEGPKVGGETWAPLCDTLCNESGGSDTCAANPTQDVNPYYDYTGAFKCVSDSPDASSGTPRVGWVKHTTLEDYNRQFPDDRQSVADYMILCSDGCRAWTEENYKDPACNNGESASQAVIARADYESDSVGMKVKKALLNGGDVKLAAIEIAGQENFFWSASTEEVRDVSTTPFEDDFFQAYSEFKSVFNLPLGGDGSNGATGSIDVDFTLINVNFNLDEAKRNSIEKDLEDQARSACQSAGSSCPQANFEGTITCTAGCSEEDATRRSLLATEVSVSGTVTNVVDNDSTQQAMENISTLDGATVDQGQTKVDSSSGAVMLHMTLASCIALVLGLVLAMA